MKGIFFNNYIVCKINYAQGKAKYSFGHYVTVQYIWILVNLMVPYLNHGTCIRW